MVLLYRIHRGHLGVAASAAGALAPLTHSALASQLYEARFYAPWLLLTVADAWALQRVIDHPRSRPRFVALVLLAAATCLIHYFGIISLGCLALGIVVKLRQPERLWRPLTGLAVGALALAAWLPVYAAQRHVLSVSTWIGAPTVTSAFDFLRAFLAHPPYVFVLVAAIAWALVPRVPRATAPEPSVAEAALLGLLALPIVLVLFSVVVQPALLPRYALPAVAGGAGVVALATTRLPRAARPLVLLGILGVHVMLLRREVWDARAFDRAVRARVATIDAFAGDSRPVLSMQRWVLYPAALSQANRNGRLAFVVVPTAALDEHFGANGGNARNFTIAERDAAAAHRRLFGFPALVPLDSMQRLSSFYWLLSDSAAPIGWPERFRDFRACRASARLLRFDREPGLAQSEKSIVGGPACRPSTEASAVRTLSPAGARAAR
jgi:hypothetical protein